MIKVLVSLTCRNNPADQVMMSYIYNGWRFKCYTYDISNPFIKTYIK